MSSGFNTIRKHSSDPHALRIKELAAELAKSKNEASGQDLESDDVRSQGRMDHSTIKFNDERLKFVFPINSSLDNYFEHPTEPDFNYLKIWFMLDHLGTSIRDISGFQHHGKLFGHPTLHRAPLNLGYLQTSASFGFPAMSFNTALDTVGNPTGEYIKVLDHPDLRFSTFADGFSVCFRFNIIDFTQDTAEGSFNRRIASKLDDANNHWTCVIDTTGGLEFQVTHNGTLYRRDVDGLNLNAWYQVMATYDPTAGATDAERIKIYVGGSEVSSATTLALIAPPAIQKDLYIGARYAGNGFFRGYIQDFRMYMDKVLTQAEVTNLNNNEITIDDISKGRIFVVQYALVWQSMAIKTHKFNVVGVILPVSKTKTHKYDLLNPLAPVLKTHRYKNVIEKTHKFNTGGPFAGFKTHKFNTIKAIGVTTKTHKYHKYIAVGTATKTHKFHIVNAITTTFKTHKFNTIVTAVETQVVRFQKDSSGTNGATQDVALTFTPKAILVFSDGSTSNNSATANYQWIEGFSDGTNHACVASAGKDNVTTSLTATVNRNDSIFVRLSETAPTTTILSRASCSFATNKVTFNWTVNDTAATYITIWAIGGVAITNAKVNTVDVGRTTTGVQNYTGLGFTPTDTHGALFTLSTSKTTVNSFGSTFNYGSGKAVSSSKRFSIGNRSTSNWPSGSVTHRRHHDSGCLLTITTDGVVLYSADFDSWISDGFSLDYTTAPPNTTNKFSYMVIKGGTWDCGTLTAPASPTNNVDTTVSVNSKTIKGLLLQTPIQSSGTINASATHAIHGIGVTDASANQSTMSVIDEHGQATTDSYRVNNASNIMKSVTVNGANALVATFDSFPDTSHFRLDYSTTGTTYISWIVVAEE